MFLRHEGASNGRYLEKRVPGRGNSRYKGPEMGLMPDMFDEQERVYVTRVE